MVKNRKISVFAIVLMIFAFVLTSAILSLGNSISANAYNSSTAVPASIGSLTLSGYESRTDGLVFSGTVLQSLYGKITGNSTDTYTNAFTKVFNSTSTIKAPANGSNEYPDTQIRSMNYSQINGGNAITVEFGGVIWNVVYLTTNTNAGAHGDVGDLIATLWMSDAETENDIAWSGFISDSDATNGTYMQNEYSTSNVRVNTLNGGGDGDTSGNTFYATGINSTSTVNSATRASNKYAKFTLSSTALTNAGKNGKLSLTDYLATPSQVIYQQKENWAWSHCDGTDVNWGAYVCPNEAWGGATIGGVTTAGPDTSIKHFSSVESNRTGGWYSECAPIVNKINYYDWAVQDYLWLPSLTEVGYRDDGVTPRYGTGVSLWGISNTDAIILNSKNVWVRTGHQSNVSPVNGIYFKTTGKYDICVNSRTDTMSVRPALHLNLTKAQENVTLSNPGTAIDRDYNGIVQKLDSSKETWFTSAYQNSVTVEYYKNGTTTTIDPKDVGTYQVGFTPKSGRVWSDGSTTEKKIDFVINKAKLAFPQFSESAQTYNGGADLDFEIRTYNTDAITITLPTAFKGIVDYSDRDGIASVADVGEYYLLVNLKDSKSYEFTDAPSDGHLTFEVQKAKIDAEIFDSSGSHSLSGAKGSTLDVILNVNQIDFTHKLNGSSSVKVVVIAHRLDDTVNDRTISGEITLDKDSTRVPVTLDLSRLTVGGSYKLLVEISDSISLDNKSYTMSMISGVDTTLSVLDESFRSGLTWVLETIPANGGLSVPTGFRQEAEIGNYLVNYSGTPIVYDGKHYAFEVTPPTGYTVVSTSVTGDGFAPNDDIIGIYANSEYTTTISLKNDTTNDIKEYSIKWSINKAQFDLSKVRWQDDGQLPYNQNGVSAELDPNTVPEGLTPSYTTNTGNSIGQIGTANVTFSMVGEYLANYELPAVGGKGTNYKFTPSDSLTDFEWSKQWTVVKAIIPVAFKDGSYTDKNGTAFTAPVLADDNYAEQVEYHFYETDANGNIKDNSKYLLANEIEISDNELKYYKVKPAVKSNVADRYDLENENYSNHFSLGSFSEAVEIDLANKTLTYNGKAQNVTISVIRGAILESQFDIVYYDRDGGTALSGAPTNAGLYRVEITIKAGVKGFYFDSEVSNITEIDGVTTAVIEYEISKLVINNDIWETTHKPPSLKLNITEIKEILYEYADMDGNVIAFDYIKSHPGDYKVRARVVNPNNCEFKNDFEDDLFNTDWQVFTVSENEALYDPLDPSNPYYPEDPENPGTTTNPGDNGDGGNGGNGGSNIKDFFEKLLASHFPLWQVIVMAVSAILAIIFIAKAAQYGSRAKKAKGEAKKISSRAYAAILPVFDGTVVALGLSNKIWSIMAFAFVGFAVAMLAVALIMRHNWKKAELAKEAAIDESEQRKEAKQLAREEAQEARQRELQETLILASQGGAQQQQTDSSLFEQRLLEMEERHRQEMEDREARYREEQAHRDETMKLMLANLMGRAQGDDTFAYASIEDTDMLVQRVIAGLLPAMQEFMPEATAYLNAPSEENEELKALVEEQKAIMEEQRAIVEEQRAIVDEQNEEIRNMAEAHTEEMQAMSAKMDELQEQLAAMAQDRLDGVIIEGNNDEKMEEMADTMREQLAKIEELQAQLSAMEQERVDGVLLPDQSDDMKAMAEAMQAQLAKIDELQSQLVAISQDAQEGGENAIIIPDQSEEIKALTEQIAAMRGQLAERPQTITNTVYVERETDEEDSDDEEEWDSILDEEDDFIEATIVDEDGTVRKTTPNFRMRLKESSDKNREWYAAIKNLFCSQKGVTYRVYKRVEKIRYQGQVIAVIGIAKRSIKLWLALKPFEYDARRYHHKDVSDKPRFVDVPLYVRVGSDRALTRAEELILALFQEQAMEARKRYTDRSIQELIFTLKHNRLLANKESKQLLCEVMHVHDCDILSNEVAEKCIEAKNVDFIDDSVIETVKLDDIDAKFQDGNRVTLDKLRKAGLVSEECTGYVVAADKRLTKPLIVVANDFTMDAVKMIVLTGGRVIRLAQVNK